jgi:HK97 gp10 family phage protein
MPMEINFDFEDALNEIVQEFAGYRNSITKESKTVMSKSAKILKKHVVENLKRVDHGDASNYDGTVPYIHMKDDIKTSVKDDKQGTIVAIIRGGKYTGYKWHLVNNGTVNSNATHFIDKALKDSENEIDQLVDEMIGRVVQDGR